MESEEFAFVYEDLKVQLKEIPSLPLLLKSVEKTTKKLECLNLYSLTDKREFDFQLFEQNVFDEITKILVDVTNLTLKSEKDSVNMEQLLELEQRIDSLKQKKIEAFDKLSKIQQSLQFEIEGLIDENMITAPLHHDNEIKQVEEDEEEQVQDQHQGQTSQQGRVASLKKEIDQLNTKIIKINRGKGRWFDGDHSDFLKIYNRCKGDASKIVQEGVKVLGMKNIEIMDHLQLYQNYLQFQKEKKLASQQFKSIKMFEEQVKAQLANQDQLLKMQKEKMRSKIKEEENMTKKMQVDQFKRKKAEERQALINQITQERENEKKHFRVSAEKRKSIQMRNLRLIEEQKEKFKQRNSSKGRPSSKQKIKTGSTLVHKEVSNLKPKLPKPTIPLPDAKNIKQ